MNPFPARAGPGEKCSAQMGGLRRHDGLQPVERWFDPEYWQHVVPGCTIAADADHSSRSDFTARGAESTREVVPPPLRLSDSLIDNLRQRMDTDGYFELSADVLATAGARYDVYMSVIKRLEAGVRALVAAGWPANFIVLFDESWHMVQLLSQVMHGTTGGNECMMDLVAWHIDPSAEEAGFTPHRDRQLGLHELDTAQVAAGFRLKGGASPRDCTCWIALSEASCDNGCIYVIPRSADPAYALGDCSAATTKTSSSATFKLQASELGEP